MKKTLQTAIVFLLIPSLLFAQIPRYGTNEPSVKQTDLARVWNALNTEVGQQIVSYIETTVGNFNLEQAKAFTITKDEIAFVPIKSFSKVLAALCYRHLEDGSEYLYLITYNAAEKGVAFTFPSGRMYVMQASGVKESMNPDFQFQQYDDLDNKVGITEKNSLRINFINIRGICEPAGRIAWVATHIGFFIDELSCGSYTRCEWLILFTVLSVPFLFIAPAYLYENSNLAIISILFAVYYYGCFSFFIIVPSQTI